MNYSTLNLDLQGIVKRAYDNLLYRSSFMNFANKNYIGELRQTGVPMIEVMKQKVVAPTNLNGAEITTGIAPTLATYDNVKVDLTQLRLTYSVNVSPLVQNIAQAISGQIDLQDAAVAKAVDTFGYNKMAATTNEYAWNFTTKDQYIDAINELKAQLFNKDIYDGYKLGLEASEYGKFVSALTTLLHYETLSGVEGVDRGEIARAYGVDIFAINSNVLTNGEKGYFASEIGVIGDAFFTQFNEWNGDRPGFPGYISVEGIVMYGAEIVKDEAVIKLVDEVSM